VAHRRLYNGWPWWRSSLPAALAEPERHAAQGLGRLQETYHRRQAGLVLGAGDDERVHVGGRSDVVSLHLALADDPGEEEPRGVVAVAPGRHEYAGRGRDEGGVAAGREVVGGCCECLILGHPPVRQEPGIHRHEAVTEVAEEAHREVVADKSAGVRRPADSLALRGEEQALVGDALSQQGEEHLGRARTGDGRGAFLDGAAGAFSVLVLAHDDEPSSLRRRSGRRVPVERIGDLEPQGRPLYQTCSAKTRSS
jgi:hypothetical protein